MRNLWAAFAVSLSLCAPALAAETDAAFAQRLVQHLTGVTRDLRVVRIAQEASPSDVVVEFRLDGEGRVGTPRIVHSILSQEAQKQIIAALTELPPIALNGYVSDATYRLPLRLEYTPPVQLAPAAQ